MVNVRTLRDSLDVTQGELARMVGVHPMTVSKWERGTAQPSPYNVQQICMLHLGAPLLTPDERRVVKRLLALGSGVGALAIVVMRGIAEQGGDAGLVGEA